MKPALSNFISKVLILFYVILLATIGTMPPTYAVTPTPDQNTSPTPTAIPQTSYSVMLSIDKASVKPGETFQISIVATNTGTTALQNFEIRVPFYKTIPDIESINVNPLFNQLVSSSGYPAGLNDRSWIINNFDPGEAKTFSIQYKVSADPKTPSGMISTFTLPSSWSDPQGLPSNSPQSIKQFRADIYLNNTYKNSFTQILPKLEALDTPVSLINLNNKYYFSGSKSTSLKSINSSNIKSFPNFTLETQDVLIEWTGPIDLSGTDVASKLSNLDTYLTIDWGKVTFNSGQVAFLSKPAKVTFKNADFVNEPKVKVKDQVGSLVDSKATWQKATRTVLVNMDSLGSAALSQNIDIGQSIIEPKEKKLTISGKVADPKSKVFYKFDDSEKKEIFNVDLQIGTFSVNIEDASVVKQVEISSTLTNGETGTKIVLIKSLTTSPTASPTPTQEKNTNTSILLNPITVMLGIGAIATLCITAGYIYFLYYRKHRADKDKIKDEDGYKGDKVSLSSLKADEDAKQIDFSIGKDVKSDEKTYENDDIDLEKIKEEYTLKSKSENSDTKASTEGGEKEEGSFLKKE